MTGGPPAFTTDSTERLAREHYENFPVLSIAVPRRLRKHFANVYAYCRWSDDLADEVGDPTRSLHLLDDWQADLERCYEGEPRHRILISLQETIRVFRIPKAPFVDLLSAFRRDQHQTRYETYDELLDYCRFSADPVGRLVLYLCDRHTDENLVLSNSICTGLQLVNFWQDVARDLDKGRIYLPRADQRKFGVEEAEILNRQFTDRFRELLKDEVDRAEELLRTGLPLARRMPGRLRIVVGSFARGGLAVVRKIRRIDYNVFRLRPKLTKFDLFRILLESLLVRH